MPPQLTLKSLPKENVYRILSNLGVRDRKRVRRCSKNMREAVQQSDLSVDLVMIIFNEDHEGRSIFVKVVRGGFSSGDAVLKLIDAESFQIWLNTMKLKYFFRRLKCDRLLIQTEGMSTLVVEPMLIQMTEQLDFKELHLQFFSRLQPSIINFVQRLTKSVHSITTERFLPNLLEIIELPWASCLTVYDPEMTQGGFSDQQVLQLAKQGRRYLSLPANLSDPTTLQCLIEIVHSTRMRCVSITVAEDYFHRFLSSIDLKEEGSQFIDVSDPSSPTVWFNIDDIDETPTCYEFVFDIGYLSVHIRDRHRRCVVISTEETKDFGWSPRHRMSLARVCPKK